MKRLYKSLSSGTVSYLETTGTGPTLLFLHGNSSCASSFEHQLNYLGKSYRCIALDFLGHGNSSSANDKKDYSFSGCRQQVINFIRALNLNNIIIVGHSLGGHAIIDALPQLKSILGVVLIGAPPFNKDTIQNAFSPDPTDGLIFTAELDGQQLTDMAKQFVNEESVPLAIWSKVIKSINSTDPEVRPGILAGFSPENLQDEIQILLQSKTPAMSIVGEKDAFINNDYFKETSLKSIFKDRVKFINECRHNPHLESAERVNSHIQDFIKACIPQQVVSSIVLNNNTFSRRYLPRHKLATEQVAIQVKASSVNSFDYKISRGDLVSLAPDYPTILHSDVAGVIIEVGNNVSRFKIGDNVYGCAGGVKGRQGALTDIMITDNQLLSKSPENLSFQEAAALPMVAITAWEGLSAVNLNNMKVLIHGGTGGVGHIAIQLAKQMGAIVYATVGSAAKADLARSLGATDTINYHTEDVEDYVYRLTAGQGFDLVFDIVGNDNLPNAFQACKVGGDVVTTVATSKVDLTIASGRQIKLHFVNMLWPMLTGKNIEHHGNILNEIKSLVEKNKLKPLLAQKNFRFDQVSEAHQYAASGDAVGKVTLVN